MKEDLIFGLPAMNVQALLGVVCFGSTFLLVRIIRGIQTGRFPGGTTLLLCLRTLLGFALTAAMVFFFGAIFGLRYI